MGLTVTQQPEIINSLGTSKWNAIGNPIIYKLLRQDFSYASVANNAGDAQLTFAGVNIASSFVVGDNVWVGGTIYLGATTVLASTYSAPNTLVTVDLAYSATETGYVNNESLRRNYKAEIGLYTSTEGFIGNILVSPNSSGVITADVSRILWSATNPYGDFDLTGTTTVFTDSNAMKNFYITYNEVWIGSSNSPTTSSDYYAVYGALQVPSQYGGNLIEYTIQANDYIINDTVFDTLWTNNGNGTVAWTLGATDLSVSLGSSQTSERAKRDAVLLSGKYYTFKFTYLLNTFPETARGRLNFSNGQSDTDIGSFSSLSTSLTYTFLATSDITYFEFSVLATSGTPSLNVSDIQVYEGGPYALTKFDEVTMWRDWPLLLSYIIKNGSPSAVLRVGSDSSSAVTVPSLTHFDLNNIIADQTPDEYFAYLYGSSIGLSVSKTIVMVDPCNNPIMLIGRNTLGGALCWLFEINQEYTFNYDDGAKKKRLILSAENLTLNKWESLQDFITLGALYKNPIIEFTSSTIKTSSRIGAQVYAVDQDGNKVGVVVIPTENRTNTKQLRHRFVIEIEYPEFFTT